MQLLSDMFIVPVLFSALALGASNTSSYALQRTYDASNFDSAFYFRTAADFAGLNGDPTNGFVNYVSLSTAKDQGLFQTLSNGSQVFLGVDNTSTVSTRAQGRNSLRLESKDTFDTGLLIADIAHMPGNQCGVWPALWTYNFVEDPIGEIDMIEGINHQADNIISLHTCDKCKFTAGNSTGSPLQTTIYRRGTSSIMTGKDLRSNCALGGDCDNNSKNFDGCGVTASEAASYGDAFNAAGGGVYALQLEASSSSKKDDSGFIKIWHFPRSNIPSDITAGSPDPSQWGLPMGAFEQQHGGCDVGSLFHRQTVIINIDFCGDNESDDIWEADKQCSKYSSCKSFVAKHPEMFSEIYWLINSIKLYQRST